MSADACRSCKFFRPLNKEGGECFRYPPQVFFEQAQNALTRQPMIVKRGQLPPVPVTFCCGEFQPQIQLQN